MTVGYRSDHKRVLDDHCRIGHARAMTVETEIIAPLPTPTVPADARMLADLLMACVHGGASLGYLAPLDASEAETYWQKVMGEHALSLRRIFIARAAGTGEIVGTGQLAFEARPNGRHRAEVQKLLVHPACRRRGLASRLMAAIEAEAAARKLRLLFLDTSCGPGGATAFYEKLGYRLAGGIPEYARDPDGALAANAIYYKLLPG
jgi:ribosomal protein S18 acetylase RimI-like enzyme